MPRNMSFALTTKQIKNGTKTVTRRLGWWNLKAGEIVNACIKCMGLKKGEKIKVIRRIRVVHTAPEPLFHIEFKSEDVGREGFPDWSPDEFIKFFEHTHHCDSLEIVNRIEFEYL